MTRLRRVVLSGAFIVFALALTLAPVHTSSPASCKAECEGGSPKECDCGVGTSCDATDNVGCHAWGPGCDEIKSC
jgi:hypothetical protein